MNDTNPHNDDPIGGLFLLSLPVAILGMIVHGMGWGKASAVLQAIGLLIILGMLYFYVTDDILELNTDQDV